MKNWKIAFTVASALLVPAMFTTSAEAFSLPYDGSDPISTGCANGAITARTASVSGDTTVELRYSAHCNAAWARVRITGHNWAAGAAEVRRIADNTSYMCNNLSWSSNLGAYTCYTAIVGDLNNRADAMGLVNEGGQNLQAWTSSY
ncbi:YjfA family protein (plasmid) [Streptomyces sp. NBC_00161]|uniref:DUF2690 domain-containing protein n=1 Tax=Streptomyces sp. NBC_00161 TaxID=2975671 RepID=UPI002F91122D